MGLKGESEETDPSWPLLFEGSLGEKHQEVVSNCSPPATATHSCTSSRWRWTLSDVSPLPGHFCISAVKKVGKEWRSYASPCSHLALPKLPGEKDHSLDSGYSSRPTLAWVGFNITQCLLSPENGSSQSGSPGRHKLTKIIPCTLGRRLFMKTCFWRRDRVLKEEQSFFFFFSSVEGKILMGLEPQKYWE